MSNEHLIIKTPEEKDAESQEEFNKFINRLVIDNMVTDIKKLDSLTGEAAIDHMGYLIKKACGVGISASKDRIVELNSKIDELQKQVSFLRSASACGEPVTDADMKRAAGV